MLIYDEELDEFHAVVEKNANATAVIDRPISAGCLITGRCDKKCEFCYGNDESLPNVELPVDHWRRLFERLRSWGMMRVDISGGEPTMHIDHAEILAAAREVGLAVVLSTNGSILQRRGLAELPAHLRIHVSVDSGEAEIHEASRLLRTLKPSDGSFERVLQLLRMSLDARMKVRALTNVGLHNEELLFKLGETLATLGVEEWNLSRTLRAGRAQLDYEERWVVDDAVILQQVHDMREAFPWMRIRYSSRTEQNGYFLLVLPDGSLATQYTDGRDKVTLGSTMSMTLEDVRANRLFSLKEHGRKWIDSIVDWSDDCIVAA